MNRPIPQCTRTWMRRHDQGWTPLDLYLVGERVLLVLTCIGLLAIACGWLK